MRARPLRSITLVVVVLAASLSIRAALAATAIDNSNASVTCTTIAKGTLKARPPLTAGGGVPTFLLLSGKLGGCTSPDGITFQEGKSTFRAIFNVADNACVGLAGVNPTTGSITIRWKTNEPVTNPISTVTLPAGSIVGNAGSVAGALRVTFDLGTGPPSNGGGMGASPLSVAGGFTGGDGGANSGVTVVTQLSVDSVLTLCNSKKGIQEISLGAGALTLD